MGWPRFKKNCIEFQTTANWTVGFFPIGGTTGQESRLVDSRRQSKGRSMSAWLGELTVGNGTEFAILKNRMGGFEFPQVKFQVWLLDRISGGLQSDRRGWTVCQLRNRRLDFWGECRNSFGQVEHLLGDFTRFRHAGRHVI